MQVFREFLAYILCLAFSYCPIVEDTSNSQNPTTQNYYVTIPHHNLAEEKINEFYSYLQNTYADFDNIIIISPNHFNFSGLILETIGENGNLCFQNECTKANTLNSIDKKADFFFPVFKKTNDNYTTIEHGIGEHIGYIKKYFLNSNLYPLVIVRDFKNPESNSEYITKIIKKENLTGKNLFIASVDFSHHVEEDFALIHDMRAVASLNYGDLKGTEVDCPNCLQVLHDLAKQDGKNCFEIKDRTSVDSILEVEAGYNNTSHVYGEYTTCENPITTPVTGIIYGKYFGFEDLSGFYQEGDTNKNPKDYYHTILTGFDIVAFAGDQIEEFKDLRVNYFIGNKKNIHYQTIRDKNIAFYTINEIDIVDEGGNITNIIDNEENLKDEFDYQSSFENEVDVIEDGEQILLESEKKYTLIEINEELKKLKKENDIVIVFINRNQKEKNNLFYDLTEYADMIVGIGGEVKEYERFNDTDIYHSIGNINEYIIFEVN